MHRLCSILLLASACALSGCASSLIPPKASTMRPEAEKRLNEIAQQEMKRGSTASIRFQARLQDLCDIPYDNATLPLVSPDSSYVATCTGETPGAPTRLAELGAPAPLGTGVEVWELDRESNTCSELYRLPPPLLLGRSSDAEGFLVESPLPDGSRRIGKVTWATGSLSWLVDDGAVNAFASIGRNGELAWCTRSVDEQGFSLVIREASGRELDIANQGGNWYFPSWSNAGDRLYAFWISPNGFMKLATMNTKSTKTMLSSLQNIDIMPDGTVELASQAVSAHTVAQGVPDNEMEDFIFYHPGEERVVVWNPEEDANARPFVLLDDAVAAVQDVGGRYLVTTRTELRYVDPSRLHRSIRLHDEVAIPRSTSDEDWRYILLTPGTDSVTLRALIPMSRATAIIPPPPPPSS